MQLFTEQFGGGVFHFQSSTQSSCCSSSKGAQRGTSSSCTSESFSSSFQPPCSSQRGDSSIFGPLLATIKVRAFLSTTKGNE